MNSGDMSHYRNGSFTTGFVPGRSDAEAYMGEMLIGCDAGVIGAAGGPCPIVAIHSVDARIGCLIHIDGGDAEQGGTEHERLISELLKNLPDVEWSEPVLLCYDISPVRGLIPRSEDEEQEQIDARQKYVESLRSSLNDNGFKTIKTITEGEGKLVELNTSAGTLVILADGETKVYSHSYMKP